MYLCYFVVSEQRKCDKERQEDEIRERMTKGGDRLINLVVTL